MYPLRFSRYRLTIGAALLLPLSATPAIAQRGGGLPPTPATPPNITQAAQVTRTVAMPTTQQLEAIAAATAAYQPQEQEVTAARRAMLEASLSNVETLTEKVTALAAAEQNLAQARAGELAKLQSGNNRLSAQQVG